MDRHSIVECLVLLNSHNPADCEGDLSTLCDINIRLTCNKCNLNVENVTQLQEDLNVFNPNDESIIWKYISLNFYFLNLLRESLCDTPSSDVLSVQQAKVLKVVIRNVVDIGIRCNLQPNMPGYRKLPTQYVEYCEPVLNSYNRLAATSYGLVSYLKCQKLRSVVLADNFKFILAGLYQIIYCPLKKPTPNCNKMTNFFVMTLELYDRFTKEKEIFRKELEYLEKALLKTLYVRETMLLPENNSSPAWFMKAIAYNLNNLICSPKGIETVVWAMLDSTVDYDPNDKAKNWKIMEIITKLVLNLRSKPEFKTNICVQLIDLFDARDRNGKYIKPFEHLYVFCAKKLFHLDENLCKSTLLPSILDQCQVFADKKRKFEDNENITELIVRIVRVLHASFVENSTKKLPIATLAPSSAVLASLYSMTTRFPNMISNELQEILTNYLNSQDIDKNQFFDMFLFDIIPNGIRSFRNDIYLESDGKDVIVKTCDIRTNVDLNTRGDFLVKLCKTKNSLSISSFVYLLNVLADDENYLKPTNRQDLLEIEDEFVLDEAIQRKLVVYRLLSELAEDQLIQSHIQENPAEIVKYLQNVLQKTLDSGLHKIEDCDSERFQTVFTLVMILQALIMNSDRYDHFKSLLDISTSLFRESINLEFRNLLKSIIDLLEGSNNKVKNSRNKQKSEFEKALDDVCDPLLPVRGHGLMTLTKLIEDKNPEAFERKNYILNILQQNLKDSDSFIYLSSINGLAAMGHLFPDAVLNVLTEQYSDFARRDTEDGLEVRMKIGEVLVKVTKTLGEMAPKYKSLLLNTFLVGAKDEDEMIRASSLSNLGEICRVLGYKLGNIVAEVLVCVHAVITTDKAPVARRAAVTVIRQLLAGLEVEMVTFLKEYMLEIYRTLKSVYESDKDDVMRLQAQLALEELNMNVKEFLLASSRLQTNKEFVFPDVNGDVRMF
ncbi:hypothetical protein Trydic_g12716 [Trypoxylus dichotomus]